jgi:phosphoglycolate phosphatase-like HAD superfamily hydrolase
MRGGVLRGRGLPPAEAIAMTIARSLVIFDVEGTLVDSTALTMRCWQETLQSFGFEFPLGTLQRHSGQDGHDMFARPDSGPVRQPRRAANPRGAGATLSRQIPAARGGFSRGTGAVRTGEARRTADRGRHQFSADELDHYFALTNTAIWSTVACGDDVQHDKPSPALIEVALLRTGGVTPEHAVMIGDTPYDAMAARRAGLAAIGMLSGGFSRHDLEASGCIAVYRDPADMLARYEEPLTPAGVTPSRLA